MDLHLVKVPDIAGSNLPSLPLKFGEPHTILDPTCSSGILDGKWSSLPSSNCGGSWCFASAHSTGEIRVHSLEISPSTEEFIRLESEPLYQIRYLGQSDPPEEEDGTRPLCLSLNWNSGAAYKQDSPHKQNGRIVSTYSNGKVAIHEIVCLSDSVEVVEWESWHAHDMFTAPAEVWSACFHGENQNSILSCGDEGSLKVWDTRSTSRPMQVLKPFEAGVTCVSPHPVHEHLVAFGSYDETVCLFDLRYVGQTKKSLLHTKKLGGGIWRLKWHPYEKGRLLAGAMHGGCSVLQVRGLDAVFVEDLDRGTISSVYSTSDSTMSARVTKKFTEHESMAYGADWLVCKHPTREGYFEAAGSCSFYDKAAFLWDTVF